MIRTRIIAVAAVAVIALSACGPGKADSSPATATKTASPSTPSLAPTADKYPIHTNIVATKFYVGDDTHKKPNHGISNIPSGWDDNWVTAHYGRPMPKNLFLHGPPNVKPVENPWYCALPFYDYNKKVVKMGWNKRVYWYHPFHDPQSILKNRWIKVWRGSKVAYCQWEDIGPTVYNDVNYVFGTARPKNHAKFNSGSGLDVSWDLNKYLHMRGLALVSWQFVDKPEPGPWTQVITTSPPKWG